MSIINGLLPSDASAAAESCAAALLPETAALLERGFGTKLALLDALTGDVLFAPPEQPVCDWGRWAELCREVARRGRPEFIEDEEPFLVLAVPLGEAGGSGRVAVGAFVTRQVQPGEDLRRAAGLLGLNPKEAALWAGSQAPWTPEALERVAELTRSQWAAQQRIRALEDERQKLSVHLATTYEEISLLHRLNYNLKISKSDEDLGRVALEWLGEVVPAEVLAIQFLPLADADESPGHSVRTKPVLLSSVPCPLDCQQLGRLIEHLGSSRSNQPLVVNRPITERDDWPFPQVRQVIAVPLAESENLFGWLVALNHLQDGEFGTVEASLLSSVGSVLGIHSGNSELYRQQSQLLAGVVRALTSAIDAKDPYTCGHSDRVARIAVRLAQELGCDAKSLNTVYLSGLLHDIGKIGVNDSVLRKPEKLTESEYEHIKQHVKIGHRILHELKKLGDVLPVVLYHHESWDGHGYPQHLASEGIPLLARIVAVADSYDAMGSDRPYRKGLPDEKIDQLFQAGAGKQWDPEVVQAFFRARSDLHEIVRRAEENAELQLPQPT